jgi:CBS-domain-containing membrane protein
MTPTIRNSPAARKMTLALRPATAERLMTANPVSISEHASLHEALVLLVDRSIHAAPVIDEAGRPMGVISSSDIMVHDRESVTHLGRVPEFYSRTDLAMPNGEELPRGFQVERVERTRVADIMTPTVFAVSPETPAATVVNEMLARNVHRLFVVDGGGILVGVITSFDVLRHLEPA